MEKKRSSNLLKCIGRGAVLTAPFILFIAGIMLIAMSLLHTFIEESRYFSVFVNSLSTMHVINADKVYSDNTIITPQSEDKESAPELPVIQYRQQFATLNVSAWELKNIPVRLGADDETLHKSAGMSLSSYFFGEGGRVVLSAHVTMHFRELEDTPVGSEITIDTIYGRYVYKVDQLVIFDYGDNEWIDTKHEGEQLVMYTCYPRNNHGSRRRKCCALICSLVSGREVTADGTADRG